jgi:hypothetical protein
VQLMVNIGQRNWAATAIVCVNAELLNAILLLYEFM